MTSDTPAQDTTPNPERSLRLPVLGVMALIVVASGAVALRFLSPEAPRVGEPPAALSRVKHWLNVPGEAPPWKAGDRVEFSQLRGKVVVIDFWSSWCPECRAANAHLNQLHGRRAEGLLVIGVTMPDRFVAEDEILNYTKENVRFPVLLLEAGDAIAAYNVTTIPYAVIVGRDGAIKWKGKPAGAAFDEALEAELAALKLPD